MVSHLLGEFRRFRATGAEEFFSHIESLLENEQVRKLDDFVQHYSCTRLRHSLDVAYMSFSIARFLGWDSRSVARAGLLHDLFLYDRHAADYTGKRHLRGHPAIALENARRVCSLNAVEEDIIRKHMWLVTLMPPRYKEAYIVTFVDKYCALREVMRSASPRARRAARASAA